MGAKSDGTVEELRGWFAGRVPDGWFTGPPEVTADREEILVIGSLAAPEMGTDSTPAARRAAEIARIKRFREETREQRVQMAQEAEFRYSRPVSWGAACGEARVVFTHLSVPIMTRLRMHDRRALDTLVDSGIARSRSDALAWCVRLVGQNEATWIEKLRTALKQVEQVREEGPLSA